MQPVDPNARRYDSRTIFFHWIIALLVVTQFVGAWTIDDFSGSGRIYARSLHITFGVVLGLLLVARIFWRATGGRRLPAADRGALHVAAKATHWGLYLILAAMVLVGLTLAWARGDNLYNLFVIPKLDPSDPSLRHNVQELHATIGWVIIALAGIHAFAALVHQYLWRDGTLLRMMPGREPAARLVDVGGSRRN